LPNAQTFALQELPFHRSQSVMSSAITSISGFAFRAPIAAAAHRNESAVTSAIPLGSLPVAVPALRKAYLLLRKAKNVSERFHCDCKTDSHPSNAEGRVRIQKSLSRYRQIS